VGQATDSDEFVPGEVVVKLASSTDLAGIAAVLSRSCFFGPVWISGDISTENH
jgi:hypothetical protein